uniref:WD_REPEATS_REGION domain-containing protein n=1 Tax=Macrostomum lignano TaxID=282301 RepID=A0A1I8F8X9_9PLAT
PINTMEKPQIIAHVQKSLNYTLYDCKWLPGTARFAVVGSHPRGTGALQMYEIAQRRCDQLNWTPKRPNLLNVAPLAPRYPVGVTWQLGISMASYTYGMLTSRKCQLISVKAHQEIVNTRLMQLARARQKSPQDLGMALSECGIPGSPMTPWPAWSRMIRLRLETAGCVAFGDAFNSTERCLVSGYDNGDLKLFDLRAMALRWETNLKNGICGLEFDRRDIPANKLVASTLEGKFHVFDMRTQHPNKGFASLTERAHKSTVWCARHLPQNRDVFMTCGGSGGLCLWQYSYPTARVAKDSDGLDYGVAGTVALLQNVTLSTQPVASFDWSPDKLGLGICASFDQCLRVLIVTKLNRL